MSGAAAPADDLGHSPALVSRTALQGLLLPAEQLDSVLNTSKLAVKDSDATLETGRTTADDCAATFRPFWHSVYVGSGWIAARWQYAVDPVGDVFKVFQGVVAFPLPVDAQAFYRKQVASWHTCDNRRINERFVDKQPAQGDWFTLAAASEHDGTLTMTSSEEGSDIGWQCERAMTVRNNVAVDVQACAANRSDQGELVAAAIAAKVPVQ